MGGMFGESKWSVLQKVPGALIPKTVLVDSKVPIAHVLEMMHQAGIGFPLIAKPDIGERGFLVEKMDDASSLERYLSRFSIAFLLQEYIDYDYEYNILYYRMPGESKGKITSVTIKQYMSVTGDGKSTVGELMLRDFHSLLQLERFQREKEQLLKVVPAKGETLRIEPVGNHARGTTFLDGRGMINREMTQAFDKIASQIPDIYIFRFDVKCKTPEDLKAGVFKIVELNGCGGEPTHIYDTGYSLLAAWRDLLHQWDVIYEVSRLNHKNGISYMSLKEGVQRFRAYLKYKKRLTKTQQVKND